jgi:hypothetical protein
MRPFACCQHSLSIVLSFAACSVVQPTPIPAGWYEPLYIVDALGEAGVGEEVTQAVASTLFDLRGLPCEALVGTLVGHGIPAMTALEIKGVLEQVLVLACVPFPNCLSQVCRLHLRPSVSR